MSSVIGQAAIAIGSGEFVRPDLYLPRAKQESLPPSLCPRMPYGYRNDGMARVIKRTEQFWGGRDNRAYLQIWVFAALPTL